MPSEFFYNLLFLKFENKWTIFFFKNTFVRSWLRISHLLYNHHYLLVLYLTLCRVALWVLHIHPPLLLVSNCFLFFVLYFCICQLPSIKLLHVLLFIWFHFFSQQQQAPLQTFRGRLTHSSHGACVARAHRCCLRQRRTHEAVHWLRDRWTRKFTVMVLHSYE